MVRRRTMLGATAATVGVLTTTACGNDKPAKFIAGTDGDGSGDAPASNSAPLG